MISLGQFTQLHRQIKDVDITLEQLQPIAVVADNVFYIFDLDATGQNYEFKMKYLSDRSMPDGVLTAFPLEFYGMKSVAVVTEKVFESAEQQVFLFHEFVHCYQWNGCESKIKNTLKIAQDAMQTKNYMWELNYPFPYENKYFIKQTTALGSGYDMDKYHKGMRAELSEQDFEYMVWQEWKEGYARYVENKVRARLKIKKNTKALSPPFDRVCFYELGSRYIGAIINNNDALKNDMEGIFYKIKNCEM
jgi:hypothetical protein